MYSVDPGPAGPCQGHARAGSSKPEWRPAAAPPGGPAGAGGGARPGCEGARRAVCGRPRALLSGLAPARPRARASQADAAPPPAAPPPRRQGLAHLPAHGALAVLTRSDADPPDPAAGSGRLALRAADTLAERWAMRLAPGHLPSALAAAGAGPGGPGTGPAGALRGLVFVATHTAGGGCGWEDEPAADGGGPAADAAAAAAGGGGPPAEDGGPGRAEAGFVSAFEVTSPMSPGGGGGGRPARRPGGR